MNRKCGRCGLLQSHELMHYNKQWKCWICDDRMSCTKRLNKGL